jgi:transcriptional regulator with XRE-family HTH domain/mannose-6-phosphate isomerase-like protein (cupin superfamily)
VDASRSDGSGADATGGSRLGHLLRQTRLAAGISVREMARRVGVSPSFISQVELGRAAPSVGTLYAIASELDLSLDSLMNDMGEPDRPAPEGDPAAEDSTSEPAGHVPPPAGEAPAPRRWAAQAPTPQRAGGRPSIKLGGVIWERLTAEDDPTVEFLRVSYPSGTESCSPDNLMRHNGWEYGHVLSGRLDIQISFNRETLATGDSINFDSTLPHRLSNPYPEPCVAIWVVVGRQSRAHTVHEPRPRAVHDGSGPVSSSA